MLLNYGVGEDSWEFLGVQGDPTIPSWRRSVLNIHWKDWCWSWNSNTLATWYKELTRLKSPWCWGRLKVGGEEDDRMRWLEGITDSVDIELVMDREAWHAAVNGVTKSQTWLSNWTELNWGVLSFFFKILFIYFLPPWVFIALCRFSLVAASRGYCSLWLRASHCDDFSCCRSRTLECTGFSSCTIQV